MTVFEAWNFWPSIFSLPSGFLVDPDSMETPQRWDNRRVELRRVFSAVILPLAVRSWFQVGDGLMWMETAYEKLISEVREQLLISGSKVGEAGGVLDSMETPQRWDNRRDELRRVFSAVILPLAVRSWFQVGDGLMWMETADEKLMTGVGDERFMSVSLRLITSLGLASEEPPGRPRNGWRGLSGLDSGSAASREK